MFYYYFHSIIISSIVLSGFCNFTAIETQNILIAELKISVDQFEVSVDQYRDFLNSTDHITSYNSQGVGYQYDENANVWSEYQLLGTWQREMQDSNGQLPVTMVSYKDACTYCESKKGRLPTADEWDNYSGKEVIKGNIWHGIFPYRDYGNDGYKNSLSPVGKMTPIANDLHDIYGNVWEFVQSEPGVIVAKGGSYLCDFSMCSDTKSKGHLLVYNEQRLQQNIGFRCVYDLVIN